MKNLASSLAMCALLAASGAAQAALVDRGGGLIYDTDLNVTWLSNANLAATETFGLARNVDLGVNIYGGSYIFSDGRMTWSGAMKWIAAMNASNSGAGYLGYSNWRLPTSDTCGGYNCTGSEMGHLFLSELGEEAGQPLSSSSDPDKTLFTNLQSDIYWSGTEYAQNTEAWGFYTNYGVQGAPSKTNPVYALAVRSEQVAAVPVPAAAWLLGSGLLGLTGVARRKVTN